MYTHITKIVDSGSTMNPVETVQHYLHKDGHEWATLTLLTRGSERELFVDAWLERTVAHLNAPNSVNPASSCEPMKGTDACGRY